MLPVCVQPPQVFTGHYEEFPTKAVLQWNDFIPEASDLDVNLLRAMLDVQEKDFPRGADTLVGASEDTRRRYAAHFQQLDMGFSVVCGVGEFDLVPNGKEMEVNEQNFLDYVYRVSELYRDFDERQVAFCTLEDDPVGLRPLVPTAVSSNIISTGKFDQLRTDAENYYAMPGTGWLRPGMLEFTKPLPFTVHPMYPSQSAGTSYTAVFLFCRLGDCVAGKCVGWARQADALAFRRYIAPRAWVPVQSSIEAYRELSRQPRDASVGPSAAIVNESSQNSYRPGSNHLHTVRELRGSTPFPLTPNPPRNGTAINSWAPFPAATNAAQAPLRRPERPQDRAAERELEEQRKSQYMRENAVPTATTEAEKALFSPMHGAGGLLAPIQSLNL